MLTGSQHKRAEVPIKTPLCWDYPVNAFLWLCQQCCGGFVWRIPLGPGGRQRVLCSPWGRARHHPDTWRWHSSAGPPAGLSPGASLQLPGCCKGFPEITPFTSPVKCRRVQMRMQRKKLGSSGPEASGVRHVILSRVLSGAALLPLPSHPEPLRLPWSSCWACRRCRVRATAAEHRPAAPSPFCSAP